MLGRFSTINSGGFIIQRCHYFAFLGDELHLQFVPLEAEHDRALAGKQRPLGSLILLRVGHHVPQLIEPCILVSWTHNADMEK